MGKLALIAGTRLEAATYARTDNLDPSDWFFVSDVHQLYGAQYTAVFLGSWRSRPDADRLEYQVRTAIQPQTAK